MGQWLTPNVSLLTSPQSCRTFSMSGDLFYLLMGSILPLTFVNNWEKDGTATPEEMASYFIEVMDNAQDGDCSQGDGMNLVDTQFAYLYSQNSNVPDNPTKLINKTDLPAEAANAKAGLFYMTYGANKDMSLQYQTQGNKASGFISLPDPLGDNGIQFICPMDELGGKITLSASGGLGSWNYYLYLIGWWD